jgi:predicted enzyme related to lactoylglutathione lyase
MAMLSDFPVQAALPSTDYERAKRFWAGQLGFEVEREDDGGSMYRAGKGTSFLVFPSAGKASGDHTQLGFEVPDIESEVAELRAKGVTIEEYDFPGLKTEDGIATIEGERAAWFKDSEGNVIGVFQRNA